MGVTLGAASEVDVNSKGAGGGGVFTIDSESNLTASGKIDASGGDFDGGEIDLGAGGNVNVLATSNIDLQATQGGGSGGTLEIYGSSDQSEPVGGNVMLGGSVDLSGDSDGDFGGDGGELDIGDSFTLVGGSITITAPINASSGDGGGGGDVSFAAVSDISQSAAIQVQGKGADGSGGTATFEAHRALTLSDIDATGDVVFGGEIDATAWCSLTLPLGGTLDTTDGGSNNLASGGSHDDRRNVARDRRLERARLPEHASPGHHRRRHPGCRGPQRGCGSARGRATACAASRAARVPAPPDCGDGHPPARRAVRRRQPRQR